MSSKTLIDKFIKKSGFRNLIPKELSRFRFYNSARTKINDSQVANTEPVTDFCEYPIITKFISKHSELPSTLKSRGFE